MLVTAYTDASFSDRGGWAVWLRSERGRVIRQGVCPPQVTDSFLAEMWAIKQALEIAVAEWPETETVLVNTDCLPLVDALAKGSPYLKREAAAVIQEEIWAFAFAKYLTIRLKHVKAHTSGSDVRSYINRAVDKKSRMARRAANSQAKEST